jgi:glucosamine-6-phosphate deaminase
VPLITTDIQPLTREVFERLSREAVRIPRADLGKGCRIKLDVVDTEEDLYHEMVRVVVGQIRRDREVGKPTVWIVPVGPVGQFRRLARYCNLERVSCRDLVVIQMDEYCDADWQLIPQESPLSFTGFIQRELYDQIDPELAPRPEFRLHPRPDDLEAIPRTIAKLGGVDLCFGGISINGHIAFNEPIEPDQTMDPLAFAQLPTRKITIARETLVNNAHLACRGNVLAVPKQAVTVGVKEILDSRVCHFFMNRTWQPAVIRRTMYGPVSPWFPASYLQLHSDARITACRYVLDDIPQQLR